MQDRAYMPRPGLSAPAIYSLIDCAACDGSGIDKQGRPCARCKGEGCILVAGLDSDVER